MYRRPRARRPLSAGPRPGLRAPVGALRPSMEPGGSLLFSFRPNGSLQVRNWLRPGPNEPTRLRDPATGEWVQIAALPRWAVAARYAMAFAALLGLLGALLGMAYGMGTLLAGLGLDLEEWVEVHRRLAGVADLVVLLCTVAICVMAPSLVLYVFGAARAGEFRPQVIRARRAARARALAGLPGDVDAVPAPSAREGPSNHFTVLARDVQRVITDDPELRDHLLAMIELAAATDAHATLGPVAGRLRARTQALLAGVSEVLDRHRDRAAAAHLRALDDAVAALEAELETEDVVEGARLQAARAAISRRWGS